MATLDELLRGGGEKQSGIQLPELTKRRTTAKAKTNVEKLAKNNQTMRDTLTLAGESDPSANLSKPTALDRIFGVLDAAGTGVRAGVNNITNGTERDLSILGEMGKALKGEKRVEGSDIIENLGVDNKWAKMLGGLAIDIALDPLTYMSFGLSNVTKTKAMSKAAQLAKGGIAAADLADHGIDAAQVAERIAATAGDDAAKAVIKEAVLDGTRKVAAGELLPEESAKVMKSIQAAVRGEVGDAGGIKFLGQTIAPVQGAIDKTADGAKGLARVLAARKDTGKLGSTAGKVIDWAGAAFNPEHELAKGGNELVTAGATAARRGLSADIEGARRAGDTAEKAMKSLVPDATERDLLTIAIGRQMGDATERGVLDEAMGVLSKAKETGDPDGIAAASKTVTDAMAEAFKPVDSVLRDMGIADEDLIARVTAAGDKLQEKFAGLTAERGTAGLDAWTLYPTADGVPSAVGYMPGMTPINANKADTVTADEAMRIAGLTTADGAPLALTEPAKEASFTSSLFKAKPAAYKGKEYKAIEDRMVQGGLITELDAAKLVGAKTTRDYADIALQTYQDDLLRIVGTAGDPEAIKEYVAKTSKAFTDDEAFKGFLGVYDKSLNLWKRWATIYNFPRFTARNGMSNKFLQYTENLITPESENESFRLLGEFGKAMKSAIKSGDLNAEQTVLALDEFAPLRAAFDSGVLKDAQALAEQVGGGLARAKTSVLKPVAAYEALGTTANQFVENQARLSAFLAAKGKGMADDVAGSLVDRALYNYSNEAYTTFERGMMMRAIPFYRWMKSNTTHMVDLLIKNPGKLTPIMHAKNVSQDVNPVDESVMPAYLRGLNPISLPFKDKGGNQVQLASEGLFPLGDLERLAQFVADPKGAPADVVAQLSPLLKTPLELVFNRDLFYGDPVERYAGETRRAPGYIEQFDDIATQVPGLDKVWGATKEALGMVERTDKYTGDAYLAMPAKSVKALKDLSPWTNSVGKMLSDNPKRTYDTLSYLTGLKLIPYDTERFGEQALYEQNTVLRDAVRQAKDSGKVPEKAKAAKKAKVRSLSDILSTGGGN